MSDSNYFAAIQSYVSSADEMPVTLPVPLIVPSAYSVYLSLVEAQFPVTAYNCVNDSLQFSVAGLVPTYTISIPDGYYTPFDLASAINHSTGVLVTSPIRVTFWCMFNPYANKFELRWNSTDIKLLSTPLALKMGITGSVLASPAISSTQANFARTNNYYFNTSLHLRTGADRANCIAKIPIDANFGDVVRWTNPNDFAAQLYVTDVTSFDVHITDDSGNVVDFGGAPWSATLQFSIKNPDPLPIVYDEQTINPNEPLDSSNNVADFQLSSADTPKDG